MDVDCLLLDRVFQPVADRLAALSTCFGLARISLVTAVALNAGLLAWDMARLDNHVLLGLVTVGTLGAFAAAEAAKSQIRRAERQSRPGLMNVNRVALRSFRVAWLGLLLFSGLGLITSGGSVAAMLAFGVGLFWVMTVYFMCCTVSLPAVQHDGRLVLNPCRA